MSSEIREKYQIKFYGRFKDDLLIVLGGDRESRRDFWSEVTKRASFFKIVMEGVSNTGANTLDLRVFKGLRWQLTGTLDIGIHFKPTGLGIPLGDSSAHHERLH